MTSAIIVGAGPAGLTTAYELLTRTEMRTVVLEKSDMLGGIARTVKHHGNRIDIGGHRFFSKSDRIMDWWLRMLPIERAGIGFLTDRSSGATTNPEHAFDAADPGITDKVMLVRPRKSRIYYLGTLFDYPLSLDWNTMKNLGFGRTFRIGLSYAASRVRPKREERSLEDFFINRFGRELYRTFFMAYTEKVWGVPCSQISASWGAQRVKGLSVSGALMHAIRKRRRKPGDIAQKEVETSLIERFLYPKYGPGQMWETCAEKVRDMGGEILLGMEVDRILLDGKRVRAVEALDTRTGERRSFTGDMFFSTMDIRDFVRAVGTQAPATVREIGNGLVYRDFITVGLLVPDLKVPGRGPKRGRITDNWIYIQEPEVQVGRLQIFNNWSEYMVADSTKTWLGLEYFCNEGDSLWSLPDSALANLATRELDRIGMINGTSVLDRVVIRMQKAYPAYFGSYERFGELRTWLDQLSNLFTLGRNGMHRYNNQDHSMMTAMLAVDNIVAGRTDKSNVWDVNTEQDYHESCKSTSPSEGRPAELKT